MKVVIVGAGEVGTYVARTLSRDDAEIILVDRSSDALSRAEEQLDALVLRGDGTYRSVLEEAQVPKADLVVAVTGSDDANVVSCSLAAAMGARRTVARVDAPGFYQTRSGIEQRVLGIHALLCASRLVSAELLRLVRALESDFAGNFCGNAVQARLVRVPEDSPVVGKAASALKLHARASVRGVVRDGVLRGPETISQLAADDSLLLGGAPGAVTAAYAKLRGRRSERRAIIVGGGDVGFQLAQTLSKVEARVQVIERDRERCTLLSERLAEVNIIHGDGTNMACLRDEQIETADYLLAVTKADETNLMVTLMAAHLGVDRTFSLVHRPGYADIYTQLGIHGTAGAHDVIARTVEWLLPHKGALLRQPLGNTGHEVVEVVVPRTLARRLHVAELPLPPGALLLGIGRKQAFVPPATEAAIEGRDHLVIAAPAGSVTRIERRVRSLGKEAAA